MKINAVISDFAGVLTTPLADAFDGVRERLSLEGDVLAEAMARATEEDGVNPLFELETGRMTQVDFFTRLERAVFDETGKDVPLAEFDKAFWDGMHPNQELIDLMAGLRERGYRMALLTNNVREWEATWRAMLPVEEIFHTVVDSAFVGMRKPDPEIYTLTLERLGAEAAETLFVDDFEHNCEAAQELGLRAVWFRHNDQAIADIRAAL